MAWELLLLLVGVAFLAAMAAAAIGPGGVFLTAVLVAFTDLSPGTVAGSTSLTFFFGSLLAVTVYRRSGEYTRVGRAPVLALTLTSAVGAFLGSQVNASLSESLFQVLLGGFLMTVAILLELQKRRSRPTGTDSNPKTRRQSVLVGVIGLGTGFISGLFGVGGPVVSVPLFVLLGLPILVAVALAQIQAVIITSSATTGYMLRGTIEPALVAVITIPFLLGIVLGWKIAHQVSSPQLRRVLELALIGTGIYLIVF